MAKTQFTKNAVELIKILNEESKKPEKPLDLDRKEMLSEVILQVLNDIKNDLHLVTNILLILFIFFITSLILMFANLSKKVFILIKFILFYKNIIKRCNKI